MENNKQSKKTLILSILSIIISVVVLCFVIKIKDYPLDFDWYGALIGVLSLLVTMLIGWNIFTVIDFDRRVTKRIDKAIIRLNKSINEAEIRSKHKIDHDVKQSLHIMLGTSAMSMISNNFYNIALYYYITAAKDAKDNGDEDSVGEYLEMVDACLTDIEKDYRQYNTSQTLISDMLDKILAINPNNTISIIERLKKIPTS